MAKVLCEGLKSKDMIRVVCGYCNSIADITPEETTKRIVLGEKIVRSFNCPVCNSSSYIYPYNFTKSLIKELEQYMDDDG